MDFHLPALTRYLAETGVASPRAAQGPTEQGSQRDATQPKPSEVTRLLSEQLVTVSPPTRLPKAVEAYYLGPAARGYYPIDANIQYKVPFNKSPPRSPPSTAPEPDPNGNHTARPVERSNAPLAFGPPRNSALQSGQVANIITGAVNTAPLDWSFLFGSPPPASPQHPGTRTSNLPASVATLIRPVKLGSNSTIGDDTAGGGGSGGGAAAANATGSLSTGKHGTDTLPGQQRRQARASEGGTGLLGRRLNLSVAAMPQTPEVKFCSAMMGVMERLAATQSIQTGRYRSLRLQAAEHREAIISTVTMPPPPKTGAFSSKAAANRLMAVLQRSGASLDDMQDIVRQIQYFKGLSDDLRTSVAQQFQLFSYPPGSYLYEQDCICDEAFVLISGTVMLHAEGRPPHRLQAGTVLGVELMLRRHTVPLTVTTDPHFEAQLAVLSWHSYEATVRRWAAEKVVALMPELQASQVARLKAGLMHGISYAQRQPGEALYVGGQPTEHLVLLVQGQVLMAAPLEANTLVTQAQMVSQLRVMMGPTASSMVLNEMPRAALQTRGGLRGGLKSAQRPSLGPSGSSVRLSGDSGGEVGGAATTAATTEAAAATGGDGADGGGSRLRRGSDSEFGLSRKGASVSPWLQPEEEGEAGEGGAGDLVKEGRGGGSGNGRQQQQRHGSLLRSLRSSNNRNSRRAASGAPSGGDTAGAGDAAGTAAAAAAGDPGGAEAGDTAAVAAPPPLTSEDSMPSMGSTPRGVAAGGGVAADTANVDGGAADGGEAELEDPEAEREVVTESAAAAASRMSRISLRFADAGGGAEADVKVDGEAAGGGLGRAEAAPTASEPTDPAAGGTDDHPEPVAPAVQPEPSFLPVTNGIGVGVDANGGYAQVHGGLSPVALLDGGTSIGVIDAASSSAPDGPTTAARPGNGFTFVEDSADSGSEDGCEPLTPPLLRPAVAMEVPVTRGEGQAEGSGGDGSMPRAVASKAAAGFVGGQGYVGGSDVVSTAAGENGGGNGRNPAADGASASASASHFLDPDSASGAAQSGIGAAGAARDSPDTAATNAAESTGNNATPVGESGAASSASTPSLPAPKSGLRSKIGGASAHLLQAVSRNASRGASPLTSGVSTPRSVSRGDSSINKAAGTAAAAGTSGTAGVRGSRGDEPSSPSPLRNSQRVMSVATPETRLSSRPLSQGALSEGTSRARRPSSPTSEAPSVDERRPESTTLLVHPILPLPVPSKLRLQGLEEVPGARAHAADAGGSGGRGDVGSGTDGGDGRLSIDLPVGRRSSSEAADADMARASTEGQPPTPTMASPSPPPLAASAAAAAAPPPQSSQLPPRAPADAGMRVGAATADPDPNTDYSIARVGGAALPGPGHAKSNGGATSRKADIRPARNMGLERANLRLGPRGGGGGGGDGGVRKPRESGRGVSPVAACGSAGSPGGGIAVGAAQPLANALASQCKLHQHRVVAVYGAPVVFSEEALSEQKEADTMKPDKPLAAHSAVALQRCEYILIPAALLRSLLPAEALPQLAEAAVAAQRRLVTASGHVEYNGPMTWPEAADKIRAVLSTSTPGHRQPWQVELLAAAFSHLPAFSRLTWQVRLRAFQDLEYRKLEPGDHLDLAKVDVMEVPSRSSETGRRKSSTTSESSGVGVKGTASGNAAAAGGTEGGEGGNQPPVGDGAPAVDGPVAAAAGAAAEADSLALAAAAAVDDPADTPLAMAAAAAMAMAPRPAAGLPRISDAPSSLPSRSPSYTGDMSEPAHPYYRPSSGLALADADGSDSPRHFTTTVTVAATGNEGSKPAPTAAAAPSARSSSPTGKLPWAARYGSRRAVGATNAAAVTGAPATPAIVWKSKAPTGPSANIGNPEAEQVEADGALQAAGDALGLGTRHAASMTQLPFAPGVPGEGATAGGPTAEGGLAEAEAEASAGGSGDYSEPSVSTLPGEAPPPPPPPSSFHNPSIAKTGSQATSATEPLTPSSRGSSNVCGNAPHPVEALFNPAAEEPLIPSLALRQRWHSPADDDGDGDGDGDGDSGSRGGSGADTTAADAARSAALVSPRGGGSTAAVSAGASASGVQASPHPCDTYAGDGGDGSGGGCGGVEFPVLPREGVESPKLLPRAASMGPLQPRADTAMTVGTMDSEPQSVSPFSTSSNLSPSPQADDADEAAAAKHGGGCGGGAAAAIEAHRGPAAGMAADSGAAGAPSTPRPRPVVATQHRSGVQLRREAVVDKLDDRTYWCLSGSVVLEAVLRPPESDSANESEPDEPKPNAGEQHPPQPVSKRSSSSLHSVSSEGHGQGQGQSLNRGQGQRPSHDPGQAQGQGQGQGEGQGDRPSQPPQQLQLANPGDAFSGGALAEAAIAAFTAPTGAAGGMPPPTAAAGAPPPELQQLLLQALPLGTSVLRARVAAAARAPLSPPPAEAATVARMVSGSAGGAGATRGGGSAGGAGGAEVLCMSRTMYEMLSNGIGRSVPPGVLPVLARHVDWLEGVDLQALATDLAGHYRLEEHKQGTELLRAGEAAPVVFLVASGECVMRGPVVGLREPGSVADTLDLATLREGATCGELSLLAARPLWYTLVVSSSSAKVISLDMPALRYWLLTSPLGRTAAADVVSAVAEVDIALYGRAVKQIVVQVLCEKLDLSLFNAPMKKILRRVMEDHGPELEAILELQQQQHQEVKGGKNGGGGGKDGGGGKNGGSGGGKNATGTGTGAGAGSGSSSGPASKRPRDVVLEGWNQVEAIAASLARPYDPQAQSWELIAQARYNASRHSQTRFLDSLLAASQLTTLEDPSGHATGDQRIAMPAHGLVAEAMADPGPVRQAKLYDVRTVPKDLRGAEVESSRLSWDCSYVPLHELTTMMSAQVHVKQAAALQLLLPEGHQPRQPGVQQSPPPPLLPLQQQQQKREQQQERELEQQDGPALPPGTRAAIGASNCLLANKAAAAAAAAASVRRPGDSDTASASATPATPSVMSSNRTSATLVAAAPWDAEGRLPRARCFGGGGGGGSSSAAALVDDPDYSPRSPSPRRLNWDRTAAPSASSWSMGPLESLAGRPIKSLSHAASSSSLTLIEPDLRSTDLYSLPDDTGSPRRGCNEAVATAAAAQAAGAAGAAGATACDGFLASGNRPLELIPEERSGAVLAQSLDLCSPQRAAPPPPPARALPPLPPPHDAVLRGAAARQSIAAPVVPPAARVTPVPVAAAAAAVVEPTAAPTGSVKRSRIQRRATSPTATDATVDDPARGFWVRDKLHDPQGLAESILADAATRAVGRTVTAAVVASSARGASAPSLDEITAAAREAAASGNAGANVLMAAGGRTGLPSGNRSMRLQPLRRNVSSMPAAGPGGAAAAGAAAAAASGAEGSAAALGHSGGRGGGAAASSISPVDPEMLYVTLQLPEAPKILPEFPSPAALREAAEAAAAAERAAREARIAAAIAHHSTRPLLIRPDMKYVPQYLRQRQRSPVIPPYARQLPDGTSENWVVPSYNSEVGFQDGFYDENSQVIYFD